MDASKIVTVNYNDPILNNASSGLLVPYITPGIFFSHDDWFAGLAVRQVFRNKWSKVIGVNARNRFHLSLVGGKRIKLNDRVNVVPAEC